MHVLWVLIICCLIHWDNLKQIMKRMYKQWWSTIPLISTKWIITSHLNHWIKKTTTYDMGNPGPDLGQAQKCGWVTLVNGLMGSQPSPSDNWISNNNRYFMIQVHYVLMSKNKIEWGFQKIYKNNFFDNCSIFVYRNPCYCWSIWWTQV